LLVPLKKSDLTKGEIMEQEQEYRLTPAGIGFKGFQKAFGKLKADNDLNIPEALIQAYIEAFWEAREAGYSKQEQTTAAASVFRFAAGYGVLDPDIVESDSAAEFLINEIVSIQKETGEQWN